MGAATASANRDTRTVNCTDPPTEKSGEAYHRGTSKVNLVVVHLVVVHFPFNEKAARQGFVSLAVALGEDDSGSGLRCSAVFRSVRPADSMQGEAATHRRGTALFLTDHALSSVLWLRSYRNCPLKWEELRSNAEVRTSFGPTCAPGYVLNGGFRAIAVTCPTFHC